MEETYDVNDILNVLRDRIGQLEVERALLIAQLNNKQKKENAADRPNGKHERVEDVEVINNG